MRLSGFRVEREGECVRAMADMSWEDADREDAALFFEVGERHAEGMVANPHAFLLAVVVPALRFGERRIAVDGPVCPVLLEGLGTAISLLTAWHFPTRTWVPTIEVSGRRPALLQRGDERAGVFFSGGIDSYASVRANMLAYPEDHPYRHREGVLVFGLEQTDPMRFADVASTLGRAAEALSMTFVTLATNIYSLYREDDERAGFAFWYLMYEGTALAAIAHSLTHRLTSMSISSTLSPHASIGSPRTLERSGSHLMLDHCYSSGDMRFHHAGAGLSRLQKTALVAELAVAPGHLRVCNQFRQYQAGALNCGKCSKCLMTKLAFAALGEDHMLDAFVAPEITGALVSERVHFKDAHDLDVYSELVAPLAERGYTDVAKVLRRQVMLYRLLGPHKGIRMLPARARRGTRRLMDAIFRMVAPARS